MPDSPTSPSAVDYRVSVLGSVGSTVRRLTFDGVEALTEELAADLISRFGKRELKQFYFQAIPRGGFFILGYLAYFLDLRPAQLPPHGNAPWIVVDDCSISGARFHEMRQRCHGPILFAHLLSHPDLRTAIEAETHVLGCMAVRDLQDLAPRIYPDAVEYTAWKTRCSARWGPGRYWIGIPERISFPWTEPDTVFWNPETGEAESGWKFASPERCLGNRRQLRLPLQPGCKRTFHLPPHVAYHDAPDEITVCDLQSEQCYGFRDTAAAMWRSLVGYGNLVAAASYLHDLYEVLPETIQKDLAAFADALLSLRLLERSE